jgi:CelD/BcsL family acetyltransferase involved in cellulose biosynthesis
VGLVLLGETIADAFRERRVELDFLRGSEPYKTEWARGRRETEGVRLVFGSPGGLAWLAAAEGTRRLKGGLKKLAGPRLWSRLVRLRRRAR